MHHADDGDEIGEGLISLSVSFWQLLGKPQSRAAVL